jgi:asparagine synthase (glutamine-hydrolysing)
MCGIAGRLGSEVGNLDQLRKMTDSISHRGSDAEGFHVAEGIELGNRRLSIIDVAGGQQPVFSNNGNIVVVFNRENYKFKDLRQFLLKKGIPLSTNGDTEVIAKLYTLEGITLVHHLRGMFAIAIWNNRTKTLFLIRDRLGKKPILYRTKPNGGLDFASEARALLAVGAPRNAYLNAINFVLVFGYVPAPLSGFESIKSLPPTSILTWNSGKLQISTYWKFDSQTKDIIDTIEVLTEIEFFGPYSQLNYGSKLDRLSS